MTDDALSMILRGVLDTRKGSTGKTTMLPPNIWDDLKGEE